MFYTYAHFRPDGRIFYLGKGSGNRHLSLSRGAHWKNIVAKNGGFSSEILSTWPTEKEAFDHEKFLISCFRELGYELCNKTNGGEGTSGRVLSDASREKLKQFGPANGMYGKSVSEETRARMSAASRKTMSNPETRAKIGVASRSRTHSTASRSKIQASWLDEESKAARIAAMKAGWAKRRSSRNQKLLIAEGAIV